jgi:FAD/FMN-containing dehydrogenase
LIQFAQFHHAGDGNLHLNVVCPEQSCAVLAALEPHVFNWVVAAGGSISAEHGIGQHKCNYLQLQKGSVAVQLMRSIKAVFDPQGILNPHKVLPAADTS